MIRKFFIGAIIGLGVTIAGLFFPFMIPIAKGFIALYLASILGEWSLKQMNLRDDELPPPP